MSMDLKRDVQNVALSDEEGGKVIAKIKVHLSDEEKRKFAKSVDESTLK
jgi:hypothetical protein